MDHKLVFTLQEIALISEEARRTATIICRERVEVLVVNRETILEYCPDVFHREYEEKLHVMRRALANTVCIVHGICGY